MKYKGLKRTVVDMSIQNTTYPNIERQVYPMGCAPLSHTLKQILSQHRGKANALSRSYLADALSVNDRKLRDMIHELRAQGHMIGSSSKANGYYMCDTQDEKNETIRDLKSKALNLLNLTAKLEKTPFNIAMAKALQEELGL